MTYYKQVSRYGRIAVGQHVMFSAAVLAPTNSTQPCGCRRDRVTGKIIHPDETIGFEAPGTVTHLLTTETGCMATVALDGGGALRKHIDSYGGGGGDFHHLRVLREAPRQMEITA
jgi:hypothetical protein